MVGGRQAGPGGEPLLPIGGGGGPGQHQPGGGGGGAQAHGGQGAGSGGSGGEGGNGSGRCSRVWEGDFINTEVTAPGATLALGLMYIR